MITVHFQPEKSTALDLLYIKEWNHMVACSYCKTINNRVQMLIVFQ